MLALTLLVLLSVHLLVADESCPRGWTLNTHLDECYLVPDQFLPWTDAKEYCQNVTGGLLTSVYSQEEYDYILKLSQNNEPLYPVWIGLQHSHWSSRSWPSYVWQDNKYPYFMKFLKDEPADYDGCISWKTSEPSGWKSLSCKYEQPFVCKQHSIGCPTSTYSGMSGTLTSSNYPDNYDNSLTCHYHIRVLEGYTITLNITDFNTEPYFDVLTIFDGDETESDKIKELSGYSYYQSETVFESSENTMTLRFKTDISGTRKGWSANYVAVKDQKTIVFNSASGNLTSPNYPNKYPNNFNQLYKINVDPDKYIRITISEFETEDRFDYLKIIDGPTIDTRDKQLAILSGMNKQLPIVINSITNQVSMRFFTDWYFAYKGFSLKWESVPL